MAVVVSLVPVPRMEVTAGRSVKTGTITVWSRRGQAAPVSQLAKAVVASTNQFTNAMELVRLVKVLMTRLLVEVAVADGMAAEVPMHQVVEAAPATPLALCTHPTLITSTLGMVQLRFSSLLACLNIRLLHLQLFPLFRSHRRWLLLFRRQLLRHTHRR